MNYNSIYNQSINQPNEFWLQQAKELKWFKEPSIAASTIENGTNFWFKDGETNLCYLAIDKHVEEGFGEQIGLIYDSPVTKTVKKYTFSQMQDEIARLAGGLDSLNIQKDDTVIIYMPMIPQAVFSMLACARIGVTHSVVFGGFAPNELAIRIDDCKPKAILTATCGIEIERIIPYEPLVEEAINIATHKPHNTIVYDRKISKCKAFNNNSIDYDTLIKSSSKINCVSLQSTHPSYILYTSGTTGKPKGIVRDTGGYATALKFSMQAIYGVNAGEVYWAASDVGWVVGHSYIVYAPLINRNTTILFEGKPIKTPDASTFWRVIEEHKVNVMFTAPTAIRAIKKEDPEGLFIKKHNLSSLRTQFLAGERCDAATLEWYQKHIPIPTIDHWWQTESGWPMIANPMGIEYLTPKTGSAGKAVPGYEIAILDESGLELPPNSEGNVVVKLPLPPGTLMDLWKDTTRFKDSYLSTYPGYYLSGDGGYKDEDGYIYITGRIDDVINVAGHRLSTADMEEIVAQNPAVAECTVIGVHCELKGQIPLALVVLKSNANRNTVQAELVQAVRAKIGAVASFKDAIAVQRLPKTRSGKTLRKLLRQLIDGEEFTIPSTIDDPLIIDEIKAELLNNN